MRHLVAVAASHGASVRVSEINSAICGGLRGVSDTFASALWGADVLFGLAAEGVRNVDFHTWTGSHLRRRGVRAPGRRAGRAGCARSSTRCCCSAGPRRPGRGCCRSGRTRRAPSSRPGGRSTPRARAGSSSSTRTREVGRKVVLTSPARAARARVERLVAPTLKSQNNVTFAGRGYGSKTTDGKLRGTRRTEKLVRRNGTFRVVDAGRQRGADRGAAVRAGGADAPQPGAGRQPVDFPVR